MHESVGLVIYSIPQFFTTFILKAVGVAFHGCVCCYIISGELAYIA